MSVRFWPGVWLLVIMYKCIILFSTLGIMKNFSILLVCSFCLLTICGCGNSCKDWLKYNDEWQLDGKQVYCYDNWQIQSKWKYDNGILKWKRIYYYKNWQTNSKWEYNNGELDGKWVFYYENWQVKSMWKYNGGVKNGKRVYYNENWEITSEENYQDGNLVQ